jgi:hypothetical protein
LSHPGSKDPPRSAPERDQLFWCSSVAWQIGHAEKVGSHLIVSRLESYGFILRNRTQSAVGGVDLGCRQSFQPDAKGYVMSLL